MKTVFEVNAYIYSEDGEKLLSVIEREFYDEEEADQFYTSLLAVLPTGHVFFTRNVIDETVERVSMPHDREGITT